MYMTNYVVPDKNFKFLVGEFVLRQRYKTVLFIERLRDLHSVSVHVSLNYGIKLSRASCHDGH